MAEEQARVNLSEKPPEVQALVGMIGILLYKLGGKVTITSAEMEVINGMGVDISPINPINGEQTVSLVGGPGACQ